MAAGVFSPSAQRLLAGASYGVLVLMMTVIAGILSAAMILQYLYGELPCPLCLLQRAALFGVCFGIVSTLRDGSSDRNTGVSLLFALLLLVVSVRQTLLDIVPRPGHEYVGSAILGLHMPVWSILIALALLAAYAVKLAALGDDSRLRDMPARSFPLLFTAGTIVGAYVLVLCLVNLASVVVQCGLGQCHTMGYALLR